MRRPGFFAYGLLLALVFTCLTYALSVDQRMQMRVINSYRQTPATVTASAVDNLPGSAANPRVRPSISYTYQVEGKQHASTRIAWTPRAYGSRQEVAEFLARYPVGATVEAWYDPYAPDKAVLVRATPGPEAWMWPAATALLAALALAFGVIGGLTGKR